MNPHITLEQQTAIEMCSDKDLRIVGVTGGAGTGKTFVLGKAYKECVRLHSSDRRARHDIVLCAPTGRAAKRIQELTGIPAVTIHKLLEFPMPDDPAEHSKKHAKEVADAEADMPEFVGASTENEPRRNRFKPIDQKIVFCDEASMIGPTLYRQLMDATPPGGCVRFFGDNNQLPPVEEGTPPFIDILERQPHVELTFNFRSDDAIIGNALRILRGSIPLRNDRFEIVYTDNPIKACLQMADAAFMRANNQIIMPTRRGNYGTQRINPSLQVKFNGYGEYLRLDRFDHSEAPLVVRGNDKFLWIKNDYNLKVFNGEIGTIDWVNSDDGSLGITTPERQLIVPPRVKVYSEFMRTMINYDPRKQIELGYAITTHKSQGSEFDTIVYCMSGGSPKLLGRRNFYTGITRARKHVIVVTDRRGMGMSMRPR